MEDYPGEPDFARQRRTPGVVYVAIRYVCVVRAELTDGVKQGVGHSWASMSSPSGPQEFVYSFQDKQIARLDSIVLYNFTEPGGSYWSQNVEIHGSGNGTNWTLIKSVF